MTNEDRQQIREAYEACSTGGALPELIYVPGSTLNDLLSSQDYQPKALYAITDDGVTLVEE